MRYRCVPLACAILLTTATCLADSPAIYVAPNGNDSNPGTQERPFASLEAARDAARKLTPADRTIVVMPGDYFLAKTFELDFRDNGLTIEAAQGGKATLYGGEMVTGWRRDGDRFWCADLPDVKAGKWDFRALVVNGRMPQRARLPESGTFLHKTTFSVRWMSSVAGGWERKPTADELTTMFYDPKDIPATLEVKNAEVRVYHMWDESLTGVVSNDLERHALILAPAPKSPPGAFGVKKYVVWNTREGMTQPGQWYLDRAAGRLVYWPLPGEDMTKAKTIAPRLERIVRLAGTTKRPVEEIAIRGLALQATTTPLKSGGFGAYAFDAALRVEFAHQCSLEKLDISNVAGQGIITPNLVDSRIADCHLHDIGACAIKADGSATLIARNHIHHVGVYYPSAIALSASNGKWRDDVKGFHVYRNEVHDAPYSGIVGGGGGHVIEENLIYRVMREMQDGGAIYGGMSRCILRGNVVRDVVKMGEGYGVSSYYLDEGATDCIVERNVSIGVERPTHNHIARNLIIRDNVFVADEDMRLSFARSSGCAFERNTLFIPGKLDIGQPGAIKVWKGNVIYRNGPTKDNPAQTFTIDDKMPEFPKPERRKVTLNATRFTQPPVLDGEIIVDEWPGQSQGLDRLPSREPGCGAPAFVRVGYDDRCLYVAVTVAMFQATKLRTGMAWGQDDGAEVCITGKTPDGKPATFVVHGFAGGEVRSVTDAGAPADAAQRLGAAVRFIAKPFGKGHGGWRSEWAIPWEALGLKPAAGQKIPFNIGIFRSEDEVWRCWEGTLSQNWRLDQAGTLLLK
jgi:hypothetical protein